MHVHQRRSAFIQQPHKARLVKQCMRNIVDRPKIRRHQLQKKSRSGQQIQIQQRFQRRQLLDPSHRLDYRPWRFRRWQLLRHRVMGMGRRRSAVCRCSKHPRFRTKAARNCQGQTEFAIIVLVPSWDTASLANSEQRVCIGQLYWLKCNQCSSSYRQVVHAPARGLLSPTTMMEMNIEIHQLAQPHAQLNAMENHTEWTSRLILW